MLEIDALASDLRQFFTEKADSVAHDVEFVRRASKLTGTLFLRALLFGFIETPKASLTDLTETVADLGVEISKQGLQERIQHSVPFVKRMFEESLALFRNEWPLDVAVLNQFSGVLVTDSTVIELPDTLRAEFAGCGGSGPDAALKLQLTVELLHGQMDGIELQSGRSPDQRYTGHLEHIRSGALYLQDLGYFVVAHLRLIQDHEAYFLSRLDTQTSLFDPETGQAIDLLAWLRQQKDTAFERECLIGAKERLRCRLVAVRMPQEVADRRRQKAKETARRKGRTPSERQLALLDWALYVTNVPAEMLDVEQILALYPVRWQVELFFKLWKSQCALDRVAGRRRERVLCELYAKMTGIVVTQWFLAPFRWGERELSPVKAQRIIHRRAMSIALQLNNVAQLAHQLCFIITRCLKHALKDKRCQRQTTYQKLNQWHGNPVEGSIS